jgi:hypothetical protein
VRLFVSSLIVAALCAPSLVHADGATAGKHVAALTASLDRSGMLVEIPANPVIPGNPIRVHVHVDYASATGEASGATVDFPDTPTFNMCSAIAQVCN